jgi:hypothetical protein
MESTPISRLRVRMVSSPTSHRFTIDFFQSTFDSSGAATAGHGDVECVLLWKVGPVSDKASETESRKYTYRHGLQVWVSLGRRRVKIKKVEVGIYNPKKKKSNTLHPGAPEQIVRTPTLLLAMVRKGGYYLSSKVYFVL